MAGYESMTDSYVAVDLETTGIGARKEKITEIAMVKVLDGEIAGVFCTLVNPRRGIPEEIVKLTGIDDAMVKDAPGIETVIGGAVSFSEGLPLLGHQLIFDYGFLMQAAVNNRLEFEREGIDTLRLCRLLMPGAEKKNLGAACAYFGIHPDGAHRALSDATAAHLLYQELKKRFGEERGDLFLAKKLQYKAKKEKAATKRQKEHLQDLIKYHRIDVNVQTDFLSGNEISRLTDRIIFTYGKIPKKRG